VWSKLLEAQPVAVLTPFSRGKVHLPTGKDISRICTQTEKTYITALKQANLKKRDKVVEKMIQETVKSIKPISYSTGQIRCRIKPESETSSWKVELFGEAQELC
jgi:hypothetical protein